MVVSSRGVIVSPAAYRRALGCTWTSEVP
jgi:hypothetical protein